MNIRTIIAFLAVVALTPVVASAYKIFMVKRDGKNIGLLMLRSEDEEVKRLTSIPAEESISMALKSNNESMSEIISDSIKFFKRTKANHCKQEFIFANQKNLEQFKQAYVLQTQAAMRCPITLEDIIVTPTKEESCWGKFFFSAGITAIVLGLAYAVASHYSA